MNNIEKELTRRIIQLKKYNQKLIDDNTHLDRQLDQALKDYDKEFQRNQKAIDYIKERYDCKENVLTHTFDRDNVKELYEILESD